MNWLLRERTQRGWSQKQVVKLTGIKRWRIELFEMNEKVPTEEETQILLKAFNLIPDQIKPKAKPSDAFVLPGFKQK